MRTKRISLDLSIYLFADEEVRTRDWEISTADITSCSPDSKVVNELHLLLSTSGESLSHPPLNEHFLGGLIGKV